MAAAPVPEQINKMEKGVEGVRILTQCKSYDCSHLLSRSALDKKDIFSRARLELRSTPPFVALPQQGVPFACAWHSSCHRVRPRGTTYRCSRNMTGTDPRSQCWGPWSGIFDCNLVSCST